MKEFKEGQLMEQIKGEGWSYFAGSQNLRWAMA